MEPCKVIALTNQKGGVGKTTTTVNLGISLARAGNRVLLIDADFQVNLTMSLGIDQPDDLPMSLADVMQDIIEGREIVKEEGIIHHPEGVDLMPGNITLSGLEMQLVNALCRESILKSYIETVRKDCDYILIDCMPSLGMVTLNALTAADSVIIPTQPHFLSAKGLELLLRSVSKVRNQINPKLKIEGILMTIGTRPSVMFCRRANTDGGEILSQKLLCGMSGRSCHHFSLHYLFPLCICTTSGE